MQPFSQTRPFFYIVLAIAVYLIYQLLQPYLGVIVFSFVVVIVFQPVYHRLERLVRGRQSWATGLTIIVILLVVLAPLLGLTNITITQATNLVQAVRSTVVGDNASLTGTIASVNEMLAEIPFSNGYQISEAEIIRAAQNLVAPVSNFVANQALALGSSSAEWITKFIIFLSIIGTLFPAYEKLVDLFKELSPLDDALDQKYVDRTVAMTKAMVKGILVIAVAQGIVAGLFFWAAGTAYAFFLTVLAIFVSVLPLGVNILALPVGVTHLVLGNIWQGLLIIAGSVLVVSQIDNILRPKLVSADAYLNPALVLLSAFGGLSLFGFLGVVYGPIIMIFFVTTIEIYLEHYRLVVSPPASNIATSPKSDTSSSPEVPQTQTTLPERSPAQGARQRWKQAKRRSRSNR